MWEKRKVDVPSLKDTSDNLVALLVFLILPMKPPEFSHACGNNNSVMADFTAAAGGDGASAGKGVQSGRRGGAGKAGRARQVKRSPFCGGHAEDESGSAAGRRCTCARGENDGSN
eukprot:3199851-Prymnesium_polylepis.4